MVRETDVNCKMGSDTSSYSRYVTMKSAIYRKYIVLQAGITKIASALYSVLIYNELVGISNR
jgi:hypothetical protein